jgi:hypothetical protein
LGLLFTGYLAEDDRATSEIASILRIIDGLPEAFRFELDRHGFLSSFAQRAIALPAVNTLRAVVHLLGNCAEVCFVACYCQILLLLSPLVTSQPLREVCFRFLAISSRYRQCISVILEMNLDLTGARIGANERLLGHLLLLENHLARAGDEVK